MGWARPMKLGPVNRELFGKYPRHVGLVGPERGEHRDQFLAFDRACFDLFLDANYGENNLYTRISHIGDAGGSILDKVFLDLDVDKPDTDRDTDWASEIIPEMRDDRMVADDVLGDVVEDARRAARYIQEREWPALAIFSGLGIHIHILTEPRVQPDRELRTMTRMIEDEASLQTLDEKGARQGDYNRLCRIANCPRVASDGYPLSLYTIPLTVQELVDITPDDLLKMAEEPRQVPLPSGDRPKMEIFEDYEPDTEAGVVDVDTAEVGEVSPSEYGEQFETFVKDVLKMPCMYERLMTRNPDHDVRLNCAALMFNSGMGVDGVQDVFRKLGWFDYDPEITRDKLEHIYDNRYRTMSCQTIQEKGLCVYEKGEREECPTFGWRGGQCSWNGRSE